MSTSQQTLHLHQPTDLLETVPYLVGFHPAESLVIVGLEDSHLAVTLRMDLTDAERAEVASDLGPILRNAGVNSVILVVYPDPDHRFAAAPDGGLAGSNLVATIATALAGFGITVVESLLVRAGRWWSYVGHMVDCTCCAAGNAMAGDGSPAAATAVLAGLSVLPDRADLEAVLEPRPDVDRNALLAGIDRREDAMHRAALAGDQQREQRSVKRALFAAAREADRALIARPGLVVSDLDLCRFAVALSEIAIRDSLWLAIDQSRIDGRGLWHSLLLRLPAPYDSPALFLFGWATWREGNGVLAAMAAERALASYPGYTAADLLRNAVQHGLDPFRTPRLRAPRR